MNPPRSRGVSFYDVLGVEPDATSEEIKAAWRSSTDKFEPGQGSSQFRLFNEAADVLLDPERRAAYDAELAGEEPVEEQAVAAPVPLEKTDGTDETDKAEKAEKAEKAVEHEKTGTAVPVAAREEPAASTDAEPAPGRRVPAWITAALAVLTVAVLVVGGLFFFADRSSSQDDAAGDDASAAAERALPAVLSYDYRQLKTDRDQAVKFLSKRYADEYTKTFDKLIESTGSDPGPAVQAKAVVKATVEDVGVVSSSDNRARVIVFLNQNTRKGTAAATLSLNRLVVSMVRSGNQWLIDDITSY